MFDYETLRLVWWILLGTLLIGFSIMDGFDLGVAMLSPFVGSTDEEKRVVMNSIGPFWEGNQVWLVLGAGAIFAAWPIIYAVAFSGFYLAMFLVLAGLILRPVSLKYRSKSESTLWRKCWDLSFFISGVIPSLIFGVAIGNIVQGVPFHFDPSLRSFYTGSFWGLLNPFALLCGVISIVMLSLQGSVYLVMKTTQEIQSRALTVSRINSLLLLVLLCAAGLWLAKGIDGYVITQAMPHDGPSNPLYKSVIQETGAWINNFSAQPKLMLIPGLSLTCLLIILLFNRSFAKLCFVASSVNIFCIISTVGIGMFPFLLPSSTNPGQSLSVWDSSSSQTTLSIMLIATAIFLPLILIYTTWVYRALRGKVTAETIKNEFNAY